MRANFLSICLRLFLWVSPNVSLPPVGKLSSSPFLLAALLLPCLVSMALEVEKFRELPALVVLSLFCILFLPFQMIWADCPSPSCHVFLRQSEFAGRAFFASSLSSISRFWRSRHESLGTLLKGLCSPMISILNPSFLRVFFFLPPLLRSRVFL